MNRLCGQTAHNGSPGLPSSVSVVRLLEEPAQNSVHYLPRESGVKSRLGSWVADGGRQRAQPPLEVVDADRTPELVPDDDAFLLQQHPRVVESKGRHG